MGGLPHHMLWYMKGEVEGRERGVVVYLNYLGRVGEKIIRVRKLCINYWIYRQIQTDTDRYRQI